MNINVHIHMYELRNHKQHFIIDKTYNLLDLSRVLAASAARSSADESNRYASIAFRSAVVNFWSPAALPAVPGGDPGGAGPPAPGSGICVGTWLLYPNNQDMTAEIGRAFL